MLVLAGVCLLQVALAAKRWRGCAVAPGVAAAALGLFAAWALLSGIWSDAPGRAVLEADRTVLYMLAIVAFGSLPRDERRVEVMLWGVAAGAVVVCSIALTTRVAADVWPIGTNVGSGRLSYPITYWNALGLLAAIGILACLHAASDQTGPRFARVLGAAALPILVATLVLTYSRGALAVAIVGLLVYAAVGRPRGLPTALAASLPACAVAAVTAYGADRLATPTFNSPAGIAQGHGVALAVGLAALGAAVAHRPVAGRPPARRSPTARSERAERLGRGAHGAVARRDRPGPGARGP